MAMFYNLDVRSNEILEKLLYANSYMSVQQIADDKEISRRSVYYNIRKINEWLSDLGIEPLVIERKKGIFIEKDKKELIRKKMKKVDSKAGYVFTPGERMRVIICSILQRTKPLHIDDFITLCQVSRNTGISDIKEAAKTLANFQLELIYENGKGYRIIGDTIKKRSIFFLYFNSLADFYEKGILPLNEPEKVEVIMEKLYKIEEKLHAQYIPGTLHSIAVFLSTIENRTDNIQFSENEKLEITNTKEYELVSEEFGELADYDQMYLALHLLGSRTQNTSLDFMQEGAGSEVRRLARMLVKAFSRLACVHFDKGDELVQAIAAHLKTSLYRYRYGIQLDNPMLNDIKNEYGDLFEITRNACQYLEKEIGVPIPEGEIAYITLHFGAFIISAEKKIENELNILVVCPNGLSTANMIREEVRVLVPNAKKIDNISMMDYEEDHDYNVVISTVVIDAEPDLVKVHPILTDTDRISILNRCMRYEHKNGMNLMKIAEIAGKYMSNDDLDKFKIELAELISRSMLDVHLRKNDYGKGFEETLELSHISIVEEKLSWKDAIQRASESLLREGYVGQSYINSIVQKTQQYGPYMFITDDVVLAHASIEDGANLLGIAVTVFKHPISFWTVDGQERRAKLILVLSAEDQVSHIKILNDIMSIFNKEENTEQIWNCGSEEEILQRICQMVQEEV